jgi:hypothetical protein
VIDKLQQLEGANSDLQNANLSQNKTIKELQTDIDFFIATVKARNATIKDLSENKISLEDATNLIIKEISNDILNIAAEQKKKPVNFYNKEQINYSHAGFIKECNTNGKENCSFTSFFIKLIESVTRLGNESINKTRTKDSTTAEKERCLAFLIAAILDYLLKNGFHWDGSNLPLLYVYQQTGSEIMIDGLANVLLGALGGAKVGELIFIFFPSSNYLIDFLFECIYVLP